MPLDAAQCRWMPHRHGQNRPRRCMVGAMNLVERLLNRMAPAYRAATGPEGPLTTPPARTPADRDVLHYSTGFRAVQIL